jgi:hypothetical protein
MHIEPEIRQKLRVERCPICHSVEGCDHTLNERARALFDADFRKKLQDEDPLFTSAQPKDQA